MQAYGENAPNFDDDERQERFGQLQSSHQRMRATQALLRELRVQLKKENRYKGSKLEFMDHFGVKLSELSDWPFFLGAFDRKPVKNGFYEKKSALRVHHPWKDRPKKVPESATSGESAPRRSSRPKKKSKKHDDSSYEYGED